jgi:hypothetical protein
MNSAMKHAAVALAFLISLNAYTASARQRSDDGKSAKTGETNSAGEPEAGAVTKPVPVEERLRILEQLIEQQQREIKSLRAVIDQRDARVPPQAQPIAVRAVASGSELPIDTPSSSSAPRDSATTQATQSGKTETAELAQKRTEELYKRFGSLRFSGDIRFRYEPFHNQGFDGLVEPPARNRFRMRARLGLDGTINSHFDWGMRLASGFFTDPISPFQTLGDFFERKPFALERAFVRYDSKGENVGVQLVAGKFEPTYRRTQLVWDDDVNVEGASEAVYFKTKSPLRQLKVVAFELPFNEVAAGKDGVLYGGQVQTDWSFSPKVSANFNLGYYDWTHADQVLLGLGVPATQVNGGISNGVGLSGNQNGTLPTTNRILRNASGQPVAFLAGFQLVDFLGNLTWQASGRFPVTFTFDYVHNATDKVRDEKNGYWVGAQVGQAREKGDWLFGYTFTRIEQDAVLVPFNFSDMLGSNSRVHMPTVGYQIANGVTFQWTGVFSQRANRVVLNSPSNRYLNRMLVDLTYKF